MSKELSPKTAVGRRREAAKTEAEQGAPTTAYSFPYAEEAQRRSAEGIRRRSRRTTAAFGLKRANRKFLIACAAVYLVHLLVMACVFPSSVVFAGLPFGGADYQTHYHQTCRLAEALRTTGRWWAYEPQFLAGQRWTQFDRLEFYAARLNLAGRFADQRHELPAGF